MISFYNITEKNTKSNHKPITTELHDNINNHSICFKYIDYEINKDAKTFDELVNTEEETIKNSCYVDLLLKTYKPSIEKRIKTNSRKSKNNSDIYLTVEKICQLCSIKYKKDNIGLSLQKSIKFFETYKVGLKAIDIFGNDIMTYTPSIYNTHISPRTLYILVHNNHCYKLNCNVVSFQQLITDLQAFEKKLNVGLKFPLPKVDNKNYKLM